MELRLRPFRASRCGDGFQHRASPCADKRGPFRPGRCSFDSVRIFRDRPFLRNTFLGDSERPCGFVKAGMIYTWLLVIDYWLLEIINARHCVTVTVTTSK